jgi:hypothetical protein
MADERREPPRGDEDRGRPTEGEPNAGGTVHRRRIAPPHRPITPGESATTEAGTAQPHEPAVPRPPSPPIATATRPAASVAPPSALPPFPAAPARQGRYPTVLRTPRSVDVDLEHSPLARPTPRPGRITGWLYQREEVAHHAARPWYKVLCLTGVDYFSTLGYQPGIAFLAAGLLSPVATLILVLFTLVAALPVYSRVAQESPHGQGSIAMLERLLPRWKGKLFVLCLLGFAATDFIITITLSAADATAHITENPVVPDVLKQSVPADIVMTLLLVTLLGMVFLKGFKEAIGLAVALVVIYLALNLVVVGRALSEIGTHPHLFVNWKDGLLTEHGNVFAMVGVSLLLFPKLALGLSGFETGVAVMPLVKGDAEDTEQNPHGRIRNTRLLLATAALVMSAYLITSSLATTLLIAPEKFDPGGEANGRALAYLAHQYLGNGFGTVYDISTIAILWFAGASAMAGLLNLVPRYLPGYGMAPQWASAQRPLVLVFTIIAFLVTLIFKANVDAQGSAYATGVLVLMTSASVAVAISSWRSHSRWKWVMVAITLAFVYIAVQNIHERPAGLVIATFFIAAIVVTSLTSRVMRSTELRIHHVYMDRSVDQRIRAAIGTDGIHFVTHDPRRGTAADDYDNEVKEARQRHHIPEEQAILLLEVTTDDPSVFADKLVVKGDSAGAYQILRCAGPAIPNAIAALAMAVRGQYGCTVHLNMRWTPIPTLSEAVAQGIEFLLWGEGDTARIVELEIRRAASDDQGIIVHAA